MRLAVVLMVILWSKLGFGLQEKPVEQRAGLITAVWYSEGREGVRMVFSADEQGRAFGGRDVKDWAIQASHYWSLSTSELSNLKRQIAALPPSEKDLPAMRDRLLVWVRSEKSPRIYNLNRVPAAMKAIDKIGKNWLRKPN